MIAVYNEKKYAEDILNNHTLNYSKKGLDLFILAKYFRFELNYNKKQCLEELESICMEYDGDYWLKNTFLIVNKIVNNAYKKNVTLIEIDNIEFNNKELEFIQNLSIVDDSKQILFCLWCCNKINMQAGLSDKWINVKDTKLRTMCHKKNLNINKCLHELYLNDLIFISDKCAICLKFLDEYKFDKYEDVYIITDLENFGLWWDRYCGDSNVKECDICGTLFKKSGANHKYCDVCSKIKIKENNKLRKRRQRSK